MKEIDKIFISLDYENIPLKKAIRLLNNNAVDAESIWYNQSLIDFRNACAKLLKINKKLEDELEEAKCTIEHLKESEEL